MYSGKGVWLAHPSRHIGIDIHSYEANFVLLAASHALGNVPCKVRLLGWSEGMPPRSLLGLDLLKLFLVQLWCETANGPSCNCNGASCN